MERPTHQSVERDKNVYGVIKLSEFYSREEVAEMNSGHFGVFPLVASMEIALAQLDKSLLYNTIVLSAGEPLKFAVIGGEIIVNGIVGEAAANLEITAAGVKVPTTLHASIAESFNTDDVSLTNEELAQILINNPILSTRERLPLHKGSWSLIDESVKLHVLYLDGDISSNAGYFDLSLQNDVQYTRLVEMASQQIAGALIKEGMSPVFSRIELSGPNIARDSNVGAKNVHCQFRLRVDEDRHVSLSFIISDKIDGNAILQVDAKATLVPVRIIKRMFGIKD
jgi:hypothetical protein